MILYKLLFTQNNNNVQIKNEDFSQIIINELNKIYLNFTFINKP